MHYTAGAGSAFSLAAARAIPGDGALSSVARLLLDGAGGLFGAYLLLGLALSVYGRHLRRTAPPPAPVASTWSWTPGTPLPAGPALVPAPRAAPADGGPGPAAPAPRPVGPRPRRGAVPGAPVRPGPARPPSSWPEPAGPAGRWPASAERIPYPGRLS